MHFTAFPAWFVLPSKLTPSNHRAVSYGLSQSVVSGAGAIGSIIFGYIAQFNGLNASMIFLSGLGAISALIGLKIKEEPDKK